jgi:hypothetical protein
MTTFYEDSEKGKMKKYYCDYCKTNPRRATVTFAVKDFALCFKCLEEIYKLLCRGRPDLKEGGESPEKKSQDTSIPDNIIEFPRNHEV